MDFGLFQLVSGVVGAGVSFMGQQKAAGAAEAAAQQSAMQATYQQQQNINQATLVNRMANRQILEQQRTAQMARSQALSAGVNQGAQYGSAIPGAYGGIFGTSGGNIEAMSNQLQTYNQNFQLGSQIFQSNLLRLSIRVKKFKDKPKLKWAKTSQVLVNQLVR